MNKDIETMVQARLREAIQTLVGSDQPEGLAAKIDALAATLSAALLEALGKGELDARTEAHMKAQLANLAAASALLTRRALLGVVEDLVALGLGVLARGLGPAL